MIPFVLLQQFKSKVGSFTAVFRCDDESRDPCWLCLNPVNVQLSLFYFLLALLFFFLQSVNMLRDVHTQSVRIFCSAAQEICFVFFLASVVLINCGCIF